MSHSPTPYTGPKDLNSPARHKVLLLPVVLLLLISPSFEIKITAQGAPSEARAFDDGASEASSRAESSPAASHSAIPEKASIQDTPPAERGGCTFDFECDDGNPCTNDRCDIDPENGPGSGICVNTNVAAGQPGECDDGLFCNGFEFCTGGGNPVCQNGPPATCCTDAGAPAGAESCTEALARCDGGANGGQQCSTNLECPGAACDHCYPVCTVNSDCSDGLNCNGAEICNAGICQPGTPICGADSICTEMRCSGGGVPVPCISHQNCPIGEACTVAVPVCYIGRCCSNAAEPICTATRLRNPTVANPNPPLQCTTDWFPGDAGQIASSDPCGGESSFNPDVALGCPKYSSGIDHIAGVPPTYPVSVGPVSDSNVSVPPPNGPGAPLNRIGDDYTLINAGSPPPGPLDYLNLRAIRLAGYMEGSPGGIQIELWDSLGNFVGQVAASPSNILDVNLVELQVPIVIPSSGRISARIDAAVNPNAKFTWMSTTPSAVSAGTNNPNILFVNNNHNFNPTSTNPDMPGTLAFELLGEKVAAPLGGCCAAAGACSNELEWICRGGGGNFQGVGILCNTCRFGDNAGAACGRCNIATATACDANSDCPVGQTCVPNNTVCNAGSKTCSNNDEDICLVNGDCPALPGVCSNADQPCVLNADCPPGGTCGGAGTCETGVCAALTSCSVGACCATNGNCSVVASGACTGGSVFQGNGTDCDPSCCNQPADPTADNVDPSPWPTASNDIYDNNCSDGKCYTGADNCADAIVGAAPGETHVVPALDPAGTDPAGIACEDATSGPSCVITITGNNATASATTANPDSCFGVADDVQADTGWYEAVILTDTCTRLRLDLCCSTPTHVGNWTFLTTDCGCGNIVTASPDPYASNPSIQTGQGAPFCDEGNTWVVFGPLPPGQYYYPVRSALLSTLGPYQMHFVAEACPDAACCLPNGTCQANVNKLECDALNGTFLGLPNRFPSVQSCAGSPCLTGSCCAGPGGCDDVDGLGSSMTEAECDSQGGVFTPGLRCHGCTCTFNPTYTCSTDADCAAPGPGGPCNLAACDSQSETAPNPCPLCPFQGPLNCQPPNGFANFNATFSDLSLGVGQLTADDFIATPGLTFINEVCVWGQHWGTDPGPNNAECAQSVLADDFRVRVLGSTPAGLPDNDNLIGQSNATSQKGVVPNSTNAFGVETYGYQLLLDNPIFGLIPGELYWLEVTNTMSAIEPCYWMWLKQATPTGNNFSAGGSGARGYPENFARAHDMAFCLNGSMSPPPPPVRPCCSCDDSCVHGDLESCNSVGAGYVADATQPNGAPLVCGMDYTCTGLVPENDDCANALPISVGNNVLSTFCTTQDGYNPVIFNAFGDTGESGGIVADQWFEFIPAQDCTLRVDMCATGSEYDSAIAVYSTGTPACNCPLDQATHGATFQLAADEACTFGEAVGGAGYIELPVTAGDCVLIRIGARQGANSLGLGLVDVSCGGPVCGDNAVNQPNEECDGIDDTLCPDGCRQDCTCSPPCVCGDGVAEAGCQEECDGADNAACHGHGCNPLSCTCNNVCGDNFRESAEECDGPADTSCGGAAGRCNPNCTCPPVVCGNNFKDPDEECDGSDASLCVDGVCRSPGDPAGACTCTCGLLPPPPPQPMPNPVGTCSGNGVICDVPSNNCPAGQTCIPWIAARAISFVVPPVAFPAAFRATGGPEDTAFRVTLDEVHHIGRCGTCQPIGGNPCDSNADCTSPNLCLQTAGASCNVASQCGPGGACMTAPRSGRCINGLACNLHSECPAGVCDLDPLQVPDFSAFEDSVWYVKPISSLALCCRPVSPANGEFECDPAMACVDGSDCLGAFDECVQNLCLDYAGDDTYYVCGELVCDPWFQDWSSHATGLHTVFVSGDAIVPRSTYTIEHVNKANESAGPITLESALWADINNNGAMNAIDVAEVVDKVKNTTGAVPEPYALLRKANPATANVSAEDIGFAANANKGFRYPFTIACP